MRSVIFRPLVMGNIWGRLKSPKIYSMNTMSYDAQPIPPGEPNFPVVRADNGGGAGLWRQQPPRMCIDIVNQ